MADVSDTVAPPAATDPKLTNPETNGLKSTTSPQKKVIAATGGAAVGSAVATLLVWLISLLFKDQEVPEQVSASLNVIFTSVFTYAAGYYTPPAASEGTIVAADGSTKSATSK